MLKDGYEKVICPFPISLPHIKLMTLLSLDKSRSIQNRHSSEMDGAGCWICAN
jgi:hypothetical protein